LYLLLYPQALSAILGQNISNNFPSDKNLLRRQKWKIVRRGDLKKAAAVPVPRNLGLNMQKYFIPAVVPSRRHLGSML
jgi:hypothetical protein